MAGSRCAWGLSYNQANIFAYQYQDGAALGKTGPLGDNYLYTHLQVDAQGSYRLPKGFKLIVYGLNLTNEVFGFYNGSAHLAGAARILPRNHRRGGALEFARALIGGNFKGNFRFGGYASGMISKNRSIFRVRFAGGRGALQPRLQVSK